MSLVRKTNHDSKKDRDHPILLRGRGDFLFHRNAHVRFFAVAPFVAAGSLRFFSRGGYS